MPTKAAEKPAAALPFNKKEVECVHTLPCGEEGDVPLCRRRPVWLALPNVQALQRCASVCVSNGSDWASFQQWRLGPCLLLWE